MARFQQNIDDNALFHRLKELVDTMPDIRSDADTAKRWLGRLQALVEETGDIIDGVALTTQVTRLRNEHLAKAASEEVKNIMFRALARAEVRAPAASQGSFIAAGNAFDAFAAVAKVLGGARKDALIVDPYMDASILTEFAPLAPEGLSLRLLTDETSAKNSFPPAVARWQSQYGSKRPVEARMAPARSLHDRSILIDRISSWISTQSFKDLAARSPASLSRLEGDASAMKIAAYEEIWDKSKPL